MLTSREIARCFDDLSLNPKCRSVVLSAEGKSFCAGIDLQEGIGVRLTDKSRQINLRSVCLQDLGRIMQDDEMDGARKGRAIGNILTICQRGFNSIEVRKLKKNSLFL